jgi:Flp pilus assembly pilin Flp
VVADFHRDDRGEHALEVLMILAFGVLPMIAAVWLLEDVLAGIRRLWSDIFEFAIFLRRHVSMATRPKRKQKYKAKQID